MFRLFLFTFLYLSGLMAWSQSVFRIDSLPAEGVLLNKGWKFHSGDNSEWANPSFDDSRWDTLNPAQSVTQLQRLPQQGIGWLRMRLFVPPALRGKLIGLSIDQAGASQLFLNQKLVLENGKINLQKNIETGSVFPVGTFITFDEEPIQLITIRYAFTRSRLFHNNNIYSFFRLRLIRPELTQAAKTILNINNSVEFALFGIFLVLGLLQLLLFTFATKQRAALSLGLFLITQSIVHLLNGVSTNSIAEVVGFTKDLVVYETTYAVYIIAMPASSFFYLLGIYQYFEQPRKTIFYIIVTLTLTTIPASFFLSFPYGALAQFIPGNIIPFAAILGIGILAINRKRPGANLFTIAHSITLFFFISWTVSGFVLADSSFLAKNGLYLFSVSFLGLGLTISLLLAQERAGLTILLRQQLLDLSVLSEKNRAQEQEKQQILATQNERLEQQVEVRTTELRASQAQLIQKEKLASLGELTAGIAHEIQNPLNFVNNFSEVSAELVSELREEETKSDRDQELIADLLNDLSNNLQKITQHGGRASAIVRGMLEHSRTETGEKRPSDLNALADEYLKIAYQGLRAKDKDFNADLKTNFGSEVGLIEVVPQEIGRVLLNLYNNAFYAVQQRDKSKGQGETYQPTVTVSTHQLNGHLQIRVSDNGTGIPDAVKAKIFQPFFTTKPTGEGTGLGLSLSYDIVTKGHGGSLTMESREGEGTAFVIQLPALS